MRLRAHPRKRSHFMTSQIPKIVEK